MDPMFKAAYESKHQVEVECRGVVFIKALVEDKDGNKTVVTVPKNPEDTKMFEGETLNRRQRRATAKIARKSK